MHDPLRGIPAQVREQFGVLVDNIRTLTEVRRELGSGPIGAQVDREVREHIKALGELRERVFCGAVSGNNVTPLDEHFARVEVLDLSEMPIESLYRSTSPQLSH